MLATLAACQHGINLEVQFAEGKKKVTMVPLAGSNIYFIHGERGYLMVDTGMGARGKAV